MKTILVTGGAGFIGSNFVRYMHDKYPDCRILVLDCLTYAGDIENIKLDDCGNESSRISFWYGNVRNADLVSSLVEQANYVVHFAAETHVTRSIYDNLLFYETDVLGTQAIANAVLKCKSGISKFIHISSSEVYGTALSELMDESHPLLPMSPYASAKAGADRLVYSYWATYNIPSVIVRPFNQFGPYQHLEKVIPRFVTSCILREPLRVHGDGRAARDFLFVEDLCVALDMILHADDEQVLGKVFNVASGESRSVLSIAQDVVDLMGADRSLISHTGDRPGQVMRHTGSAKSLTENLGWGVEVPWERGLERTVRWYRENENWWKKQMWMRSVPIFDSCGRPDVH